MRRFLAIATVLFSLSAFAERIDIQPPNPESTTQITVLITGSNHCVPNAPAVNVTGTEIGLSLMFDSQCASQANPFAIPVRLPLLQPATYTLTLLSGNPPAPNTQCSFVGGTVFIHRSAAFSKLSTMS